jgi:hypothetical protein
MEEPTTDRSDPGARARVRLEHLLTRERRVRTSIALALGALAVAAPIAAASIADDPGATVGAIVIAALFVALAVAIWPHPWSPEEHEHHELESIWRELRSDADGSAPWERYAAWAQPSGAAVELILLTRAPAAQRTAASSRYSARVVRRLDADDVAAAAEAMEQLRAEAWELELAARQRYEHELGEAERREHERVLREVDEDAAADLKAREELLERELEQQEAAERLAQSEAVARALRRP